MNASDEQVAGLEREFEEADGPSSSVSLRDQCNTLFEGAGNSLLRRLYESTASRSGMMQNLSLRSTGRAEASRHEVRQMIDQIKARDVAIAVHASREHVRSAKEAATRALRAIHST
jgi:DNA-binding GntR family transcriptional regulator